jgi:hypothetical protein
MKLVSILLLLLSIPIGCAAENNCIGSNWHGSGSVEVKVSVYTFKGVAIRDADVRIFRYDPYQDKSDQVSDNVEGKANSDGVVILKPTFDVFGFSPLPSVEGEERIRTENCEGSKGFSATWRFILVQKKGFHSFYAEIDDLLKKPIFKENEIMKDALLVKLIEDDI